MYVYCELYIEGQKSYLVLTNQRPLSSHLIEESKRENELFLSTEVGIQSNAPFFLSRDFRSTPRYEFSAYFLSLSDVYTLMSVRRKVLQYASSRSFVQSSHFAVSKTYQINIIEKLINKPIHTL